MKCNDKIHKIHNHDVQNDKDTQIIMLLLSCFQEKVSAQNTISLCTIKQLRRDIVHDRVERVLGVENCVRKTFGRN